MGVLKTTLLGGLVFLLPLVVVVTLGKAFKIIKFLAQPLDLLFKQVSMYSALSENVVTSCGQCHEAFCEFDDFSRQPPNSHSHQ